MDLHVVQLDGTFLATLRAEGSVTVGQLLQQLPPDSSGTPASWRRLVLGSKPLHRHTSLEKCGLQDGATVCVVKCEPHFTLDLKGNDLGASGLSAFARHLPQDAPLKHLNIAHCNIDASEGRTALTAACRKLTPLQQIDLTSNNVFSNNSADLLHALDLGEAVQMATLEDVTAHLDVKMLSLSRCRLRGAEGGKCVASFCTSSSLSNLDLSNNPGLKKAGLAAFVEALPPSHDLRMLDFSNCGLEAAEGGRLTATALLKMPSLEELMLGANEALASPGLAALAMEIASAGILLELKSLDLSHCGLQEAAGGNAIAMAVRGLPHLKKLNISKNDLGNAGVGIACDGIAVASGLESLTLGTVGLSGEEGGRIIADCLASLPKLTLLSLMGNVAFGGAGVLSLVHGMPASHSLRTLILNRCELAGAITGRHLASLLAHTQLLGLSDNPLLDSTAVMAVADNLPRDVLIESLFLSGCGVVGDAGGQAIGRLACKSRGLWHINLGSSVGLDVEGILAMATCFQEGISLTSIDLMDSRLMGPVSGNALAVMLLSLPALTSLDLSGNLLGADGILAFAEGLTGDMTLPLKSLNLRGCGLLGVEGGSAAAVLLDKLVALEEFNLSSNRDFGAEGVDALASRRDSSLALRKLDLTACGLEGIAAGSAVARLLCRTPNLEQIGLSNNALGAAGLKSLLTDLPHLLALSSANLGYCQLEGEQGAEAAAVLTTRLCMPDAVVTPTPLVSARGERNDSTHGGEVNGSM